MIKPPKDMIREKIQGRILFNETLSEYTTFKIGGTAPLFIEPSSIEDLKRALLIVRNLKLRPMLIGNGSNLLIDDRKLNVAVIRLSAPAFKGIRFSKDMAMCGSGSSLARIITKSMDMSLAGLEGLCGIPGTLGGAIIMNAGTKHGTIGEHIAWIKVMDLNNREISILRSSDLKFRYRDSNLSGYIILEAGLRLKKDIPEKIYKRFRAIAQEKLKRQEYALPNAGCIFKNPEGSRLTSGELLDNCGAKGMSIGSAQVSKIHANFINNLGGAAFKDVVALMDKEVSLVKKRYGICLEPEIKIIK